MNLAAIIKKSFRNKALTLQSGCETAIGKEQLSDEVIQLAAGMLAAGYPAVIATISSSDDGDPLLVADLVCAELKKDKNMGDGMAARTLHGAAKAVWERIGENKFGR